MAEFTFDCPVCDVSIETDDSLRGTTVQCPECSSYIAVPSISLSDGMELGDYKLERRLGVGGMGEVWLAIQRKLDRKVALKVLSPSFTRDQEFVSRFVQEVKMAGRLNHPNIVTAYDAGCASGMHYLAIEFVDGVELSNRLKIDKTVGEKEALRIAEKIADALRYAWTKFKILHRDIKPSNIMISADGEPKLMDMGISKSMAEDSSLTMTGVVVGTPYYMSPEQAKASKDIDCRADIYSLGATLYHLVTGTVPYDGPTALAIISRHMSESLPPPQERNPALSPQCAALIETMMAKDREDRQPGWDETLRDIELVLAGNFPATNRPAEGKSLVMRQGKRDATARMTASQFNIKPPDPIPSDGAAASPTRRGRLLVIALAILLPVAALLAGGTLFFLSHDAKRKAREAELKLALERQREESARKLKEAQSKAAASAGENDARQRMEAIWESASSMAETALKKDSGFDLAIESLNKFMNSGVPDEIYMHRAKKLRRDLVAAQEKAVKASVAALVESAKPLLESKNFAAAASLMRSYCGEFEGATKDERERLASLYEEMAAKTAPAPAPDPEMEAKKAARERFERAMSEAASALLASKAPEAADALKAASANPALAEFAKGLQAAEALCAGIRDADALALEGFSKEVGQDLSLEINGKRGNYKLSSVKNGKLYLSFKLEEKAMITKPFALTAVGIDDKAARLEGEELKAACLGLEAARKKLWFAAKENLSKAEPLSSYFLAAIDSAQTPAKTTNAGHGESRKPEIQSILKGKVMSFDKGSLLVDIQYDFNDPAQWEDWRALPSHSPKSATISKGSLVIETETMAGFELKPKFADLQVKSTVSFSGNGIVQGISGDNDSLALVVSGFMAEMDGYMRSAGEGRRINRLKTSEAKPDRKHDLELAWRGGRADFSVDGKSWPPLPLNAAQDGVSFRIGIIKAKNEYDGIRVKGRLSKDWYESEISRAPSSPPKCGN